MGELEAIDSQRCQAEWKTGSFMSFGPRINQRCENKPHWIAVDASGGEFQGAMSLCDECLPICEAKLPHVKYQKLT